jgi:hypothetical protein
MYVEGGVENESPSFVCLSWFATCKKVAAKTNRKKGTKTREKGGRTGWCIELAETREN